jgi:hypothetical protein
MGQNVFRCVRYAPDYGAFKGKTLTPGAAVELNPTASNCTITTTDIRSESAAEQSLSVFPNPASDEAASIHFALPRSERVRLALYDVLGREVAVVLDADMSGGEHTVSLALPSGFLPSGTYRLQLRHGENAQSVLVHLIR